MEIEPESAVLLPGKLQPFMMSKFFFYWFVQIAAIDITAGKLHDSFILSVNPSFLPLNGRW
jgi:hypothetical protein